MGRTHKTVGFWIPRKGGARVLHRHQQEQRVAAGPPNPGMLDLGFRAYIGFRVVGLGLRVYGL